jgi:hypothetical protein
MNVPKIQPLASPRRAGFFDPFINTEKAENCR